MFLSDAHQPDVDFMYSSAVILKKIPGRIVSLRVETFSNKNLVASRHIKREKGPSRVDLIVLRGNAARETGSEFVPRNSHCNSPIGQFDTTETQSYRTETVSII